MQFVLRTGSGYENVDERFPETSAEASHGCIAQLRTKRDLCRKKKAQKIYSLNKINSLST